MAAVAHCCHRSHNRVLQTVDHRRIAVKESERDIVLQIYFQRAVKFAKQIIFFYLFLASYSNGPYAAALVSEDGFIFYEDEFGLYGRFSCNE